MKNVFATSLIVTMMCVFGFNNLYAADELALLTWKGYAPQALVEKFQKETDLAWAIQIIGNWLEHFEPDFKQINETIDNFVIKHSKSRNL